MSEMVVIALDCDVSSSETNLCFSFSEVSKSVELTTRGHLAILEVSLGSEKIIRMNSRDSQKGE